jgi:hypothetical protein
MQVNERAIDAWSQPRPEFRAGDHSRANSYNIQIINP